MENLNVNRLWVESDWEWRLTLSGVANQSHAHITQEGFENSVFFPKTRKLKAQRSLVILDFCLRKIRSRKSHVYNGYIVLGMLRF